MLFLELLKYRQAARLGKGKKLFRSIIVCFFLFFLVQFSRSLPVFGFVRQAGLFTESLDVGCLQSLLTAQAVQTWMRVSAGPGETVAQIDNLPENLL